MSFCSLNNAYDGKPYYRNEPAMYKTYDVPNKNNLLKEYIQQPVNNKRLIKKYESPLTVVGNNSYIEGKWRDNPEHDLDQLTTTYPYPYCHKKKFFDKDFIKKLKDIMRKNDKYKIPYKTMEVCRLCFKTLGSNEYVLQNDDETFRFHDSILHYYLRHNVYPSKEFYGFIMNY